MFDRLVADGNSTTTGGEMIGRINQYNKAGKKNHFGHRQEA
ncbi:hypothetical protein [Paraburkholderia sp. J8-2]|nr:hypothetical protein [Paraburkholderia sp. J8-2]